MVYIHRGENVHGILTLPAQVFYCILKQPLEPTALYYTCTVGATPVVMSSLLAKHTNLYI